MKKFFLVLLLSLCFLFVCGCSVYSSYLPRDESDSLGNKGTFVIVEEVYDMYVIVYHAETKVMYVVTYDGYCKGIFTLLVDSNGNPLLWEGA